MLEVKRISEVEVSIRSDKPIFILSSSHCVALANQRIKNAQLSFYTEEQWEKIQRKIAKARHARVDQETVSVREPAMVIPEVNKKSIGENNELI